MDKEFKLQDAKISNVETNQIEQEDLFLIVQKEDKYLIALTNQIISHKKFNTADEAKAYINSKPYELIYNGCAVMMNILNNNQEA